MGVLQEDEAACSPLGKRAEPRGDSAVGCPSETADAALRRHSIPGEEADGGRPLAEGAGDRLQRWKERESHGDPPGAFRRNCSSARSVGDISSPWKAPPAFPTGRLRRAAASRFLHGGELEIRRAACQKLAMFQPARIGNRQTWAPGLISFTLEGIAPDFQPGQFFQIGLRDPAGEIISRSYSVASAPGQPLEFFLSEVPGGTFSPQLFALGEGDELLVDDAPLGFFTLSEVPDTENLWLLATGTGLGPYLSMLRAKKDLTRFSRIIVVHGVRQAIQLAYCDELEDLAKDQHITYVPLTSQDEPPPEGLQGRITSAFDSGRLEEKAQVPIDTQSHLLLCGNPNMITEMSDRLKQRGLSKHRRRSPGHFNFEKYW